MMKTRSATIYQLLVITILFMSGWSFAHAEVFAGYPDIIVCETGEDSKSPAELIFYLESRDEKGTVYYRSSYQLLSLKVGKDYVVRAEAAGANSCLNKSLDELRKQGRVFNFKKQ